MPIDWTTQLGLLLLIGLANGAPIVARKAFGARWAAPLDRGRRLSDGRRVLGATKTARGALAAVAVAGACAPLLGFPVQLGLAVGAAAMLGDAASSFVKRRLGVAESGRVPLLDQVPECLLPLLVALPVLDLDWLGIALVTAAFTLLDMTLSPLLYWLRIRRKPY